MIPDDKCFEYSLPRVVRMQPTVGATNEEHDRFSLLHILVNDFLKRFALPLAGTLGVLEQTSVSQLEVKHQSFEFFVGSVGLSLHYNAANSNIYL